MTSATTQTHETRNRLLAALPRGEYERLLPLFELVTVTTKELISLEENPIEHAYFPESGILTLLARSDGEDFSEIATVGNEGMVGTLYYWV